MLILKYFKFFKIFLIKNLLKNNKNFLKFVVNVY